MSTIRDERDLSDLWTETPQKRKEKQEAKKRKQERTSKEMLRRVADFNEAMNRPTRRVGENRPQQPIKVVDGGGKLPRAKIEMEDDVAVKTEYEAETSKYHSGGRTGCVKVNISVEDKEVPKK